MKAFLDVLFADCIEEEHSSSVQVVTRTINVSIERDGSGSLGITLRGGAHPDPGHSRPLIITQIKPGGAADRWEAAYIFFSSN